MNVCLDKIGWLCLCKVYKCEINRSSWLTAVVNIQQNTLCVYFPLQVLKPESTLASHVAPKWSMQRPTDSGCTQKYLESVELGHCCRVFPITDFILTWELGFNEWRYSGVAGIRPYPVTSENRDWGRFTHISCLLDIGTETFKKS